VGIKGFPILANSTPTWLLSSNKLICHVECAYVDTLSQSASMLQTLTVPYCSAFPHGMNLFALFSTNMVLANATGITEYNVRLLEIFLLNVCTWWCKTYNSSMYSFWNIMCATHCDQNQTAAFVASMPFDLKRCRQVSLPHTRHVELVYWICKHARM